MAIHIGYELLLPIPCTVAMFFLIMGKEGKNPIVHHSFLQKKTLASVWYDAHTQHKISRIHHWITVRRKWKEIRVCCFWGYGEYGIPMYVHAESFSTITNTEPNIYIFFCSLCVHATWWLGHHNNVIEAKPIDAEYKRREEVREKKKTSE